ncbi:MAG: CUB domain-containing protein, partial [Cryomorphaceae bacterium]
MLTNRKCTLLIFFLTLLFHLGSIAQDVGCGEEWFDSGGEYGVYGNQESSTTTFCPDNEGEFVTLTFNHVDIQANSSPLAANSCNDYLEFFDGPDTNSPSLGQFCGQESGNGINPFNTDQLLSVGDAFTATNPEGCLTVVFESSIFTNTSGWEAFVSCGPPPNCTPTVFTVETERNCQDLNFDATVTIDEVNPAGFSFLNVTAELDGVQLDAVPVPNLGGQSVTLEDLPLDEDIVISVDVSGQYCPSFEVLNLPSIGCPISLTCGEAFEFSYCFFDSDTATFLYQSPNDEPVEIIFQSGSLESCCDFIRIYDGEDNTGDLLYNGNNGGDLTGIEATANSGSLYMELDTDQSTSCQGVFFYDNWNYIEWNWIVGCG